MKHFYSSFVVTAIGLAIAFYLGSWYALYITILLSILEVSLSFDNAVVNAKVLNTMEPKWQRRFITIGIPIAVFGMRFIFPILIVSAASSMSFFQAFDLALNDPDKYHHTLESTKNLIFAFGGSFLLMVFLDFFFEQDREHKWIKILESNRVVDKVSEISNVELMIAMGLGLILVDQTKDVGVALAYFGGILLHSIIASLDELLSTDGVRSGIMGFLYLEVLDASFSFDGVIGAFALSSNIFIIMIGLGIGAMFVRSLTLYFVEKKTLSEFRYLEHGAHYAILALSLVMFMKMFFEISEILVGTIGITFIGIAVYHSIQANKKDQEAANQ
ncbi:MAG: DUF475 domain-containing protein [Campylobacterales bacterium]|nr:DUF475 domain-containing protein [Campylobacterales bacterium]